MVPIPPAFDTAAAKGPPEVRAIPASIMGYLIPRSLVSGVFNGGGDDDDDIVTVGNAKSGCKEKCFQ